SDLALAGFNAYLEKFKTGELAPDARFLIGEIYLAKEDFDHALPSYEAVIADYPASARVMNAQYMSGVVLVKTGRREEATKRFQTVIDKYPAGELADRARMYLKLLANAPKAKRISTQRRSSPIFHGT